MPVEVFCTCGKKYEIPDGNGGKQFRCRQCRSVNTVPQDPVFAPDDGAGLDVDTSEPLGSGYRVSTSSYDRTPMGEPWYYSLLSGWTKFVWVLGLGLGGLVAVVGLRTPETALIGVIAGGVIALMSSLFAAPTLLLVDLARNVRAIRHRR